MCAAGGGEGRKGGFTSITYLIRIKRHQEKDIKIKIKEDLIIYRPICEKNDNSIYNDWEKVNYEIAIIGGTCAHKKIVKKKFKKGYILRNCWPLSIEKLDQGKNLRIVFII